MIDLRQIRPEERPFYDLLNNRPPPWRVADLGGKYYGTKIVADNGYIVVRVWDHGAGYGEDRPTPSKRQDASFTSWAALSDDDKEAYCDQHWETQADYDRACAIVAAVNALHEEED